MEICFLGKGPRPVLSVGCPRERYNLGRSVTLGRQLPSVESIGQFRMQLWAISSSLLAAGEMSAEVLREDPGDGPWRPLWEFVVPTEPRNPQAELQPGCCLRLEMPPECL